MASENVPRPVQCPSPVKISAPTPADSRPGTSTSSSDAPPRPATSISRNAPTMGEPSSVLMDAKVPAAATMARACAGASRLATRIAQIARPPPSAISGASGPSTAPSVSVASAASTTPGSCAGPGAPLVLSPSTGEWPPRPGR